MVYRRQLRQGVRIYVATSHPLAWIDELLYTVKTIHILTEKVRKIFMGEM